MKDTASKHCLTSRHLSWDPDMVSPPEAWPWSLDSDPDPELDNESHRLESGSTGQGTLLRLRARWAPDLVTPPELRAQELGQL